jgi:hypothetical protein
MPEKTAKKLKDIKGVLQVKKMFSLLISVCMATTILATMPLVSAAEFAGGTGSPSDPFLIENVTQLNNMRNHLTSSFRLTKDISVGWWTPVGEYQTASRRFTGALDGAGHTLSNLLIQGSSYQGLFGCTDDASISNLKIAGGSINASGSNVGGFVGYAKGTLYLTNCESNVAVSGDSSTGGLVGNGEEAIIRNCTFSGTVSGYRWVGGIIGEAGNTTPALISNCRVISQSGAYTGITNVIGSYVHVGGIVGNLLGDVKECYVNSKVQGTGYVGGIAGSLENGSSIYDCFTTGEVVATTIGEAGGIVGQVSGGGANKRNSILRCYSTSGVYSQKGNETGGISGSVSSTSSYVSIDKCVALNSIVSQPQSTSQYIGKVSGNDFKIGTNYSLNSVPLIYKSVSINPDGNHGNSITAAQAESQSFYQGLGWNFTSVWVMDKAALKYPILQWAMEPRVSITPDDITVYEFEEFNLTAVPTKSGDTVASWSCDLERSVLIVKNGNIAECRAFDVPDGQESVTMMITVTTAMGATASAAVTIVRPPHDDLKQLTVALMPGEYVYLGGLSYDDEIFDLSGAKWDVRPVSDLVSVDENGKVTANTNGKYGAATVVAELDSGRQHSIKVIVRERHPILAQSINFTPDVEEMEIDINSNIITRLNYEISPTNATNTKVNWIIPSEDGIVQIVNPQETGTTGRAIISPLKTGTTTVTVEISGTVISDTIEVNVINPIQSITLSMPDNSSMTKDETRPLDVQVVPASIDEEITWNYSPAGIVKVTETDGFFDVTALSGGKVTVWASTNWGVESNRIEIEVEQNISETLAAWTDFNLIGGNNERYAETGTFSFAEQNNNAATLNLIGATFPNALMNKTARGINWHNSENTTKAWTIKIPTNGCTAINVSFNTLGNNTSSPNIYAPSEFVMEYNTDGGSNYTPVRAYSVGIPVLTVNETITVGNAEYVYVQLRCTSNINQQNGAAVTANGNSLLRNLAVTGLK